MPPHDPSDDFSQLPTADGGGPRQTPGGPSAPVRRQQTRIGPKAQSQPQPSAEEPAAPLSHDWQELLNSPAPTDPLSDPPEPEPTPPTPAPAPPKRTVIGPRQPLSESPLQEFQSAASEQPAAPPLPPSETPQVRRKTFVGRMAAVEPEPKVETAPLAPSSQASEATSNEESSPAQAPASEPPATKQKPRESESPKRQKKAGPSFSEEQPASSPAPETQGEADKKDASTSDGEEAPADKTPPPLPPAKRGAWQERWDRWGGKALGVSLLIHLALLIGGGAWVVTQVMDPQVDFIPGGGTQQGAAASQDLEHKIQQKKNPWRKALPARKIAAVGSISDIVLPDEVPDLLDLPQSNDLLGGKLSTGMGLAGSGGGFGSGVGLGNKAGMVFSMFGMQIKSKKLALVLDVSTSMAPHLPRVIAEVDKVSRGSVVILYFGCGLEKPPPRGLDGDEIYSTSSVEFEKFWRLGGATLEDVRKFTINRKNPIPSEDIFRLLSKRPQTYFIHNVGLGYAWLALLSDRVRDADGIYWFSDFQDRVDFSQINIVQENLLRRKQRLYMHAYMRGESFDLVKTQLVDPTHGDVKIEDE